MSTLKFITLPDGRRVAYSEYGNPHGIPVFHFHGAYSSRFEPLLIGDEKFRQYGFRVITPDRPGMGQSDPQKGRQYQDYPKDIVYLADALEIKQFAVVGVSGGGPHVAVCAATIPHRLTTATIVSGAWRMDWSESLNNLALGNRLTWICAKRFPLLSSILQKALVTSMTGDKEKIIKRLEKSMDPIDFQALVDKDKFEPLIEMTLESSTNGSQGSLIDLRLVVRDFGFNLRDVFFPISIFHGLHDKSVPLALVEKVSEMLPEAKLKVYSDTAHISTYMNCFHDIATAIKG